MERGTVKTLWDVLDEHSITELDGETIVRRFPASGNRYIDRALRAVNNYDRMFVPIVDDVVRDDLRIVAAPADAVARLLQREGVLS
jgi:hypothetical protein